MAENEVRSSCHEFQSITNLYKGLSNTDIKLEIYEYGRDALEAKLINKNYSKQCTSLKMQLTYFSICFTVHILIVWFKIFIHTLFIDIVLILWLMVLLWCLTHLVEFEKFILCQDFGMHLQVQKYYGRENRFIPASHIHDIVINEVMEHVNFRYLLIIRTKGKLFIKRPIICILKEFKPSFKCLNLIYQHIIKVIGRNSMDSISSEHL